MVMACSPWGALAMASMPLLARLRSHLLQVNGVGSYGAGLLFAIDPQGNVSLPPLGGIDTYGVGNDLVEVEFLQLNLAPALHQFSQVLDNVHGVLVGFAYIGKQPSHPGRSGPTAQAGAPPWPR